MSKRTRPYEDIDIHQLPKHSVRGLGQSKRVKRKTETIIPDKENIPFFPQTKECKSLPQQIVHPPKTKSIKSTKQPRSRVLQRKTNNRPKLLACHPVSKHIVKSDLYNDEGWIGRQQRLFTSILNEVLESPNAGPDPWDEESIRKAAFEFYQADSFQLIVRRLKSVPHFSDISTLISQGIQNEETCSYRANSLLSRYWLEVCYQNPPVRHLYLVMACTWIGACHRENIRTPLERKSSFSALIH